MQGMTLVLSAALATSPWAGETPSRLPFIDDDYARARAAAKMSQRPLFVEVWAPW